MLWPCRERCVNIRLGACAAPATVECVTVYRAVYKGLPRVSRGQLATIVERIVNQNCCSPEQVRCQIIARFRLHIVTVFRAQISGGARWELGGVGVWVGIETRRWKNSRILSQRKNFNKAPAKALFSLVPVFKCKWFFQDLKNKTYSQN